MERAHSDRSLEPHADLEASTPPTLIADASVPGASRPHRSLAHCPMSSITVVAASATYPGTERSVVALVITSLSGICVTTIGADRLAGFIHNGQKRWAGLALFWSGEAGIIPSGGREANRLPERA